MRIAFLWDWEPMYSQVLIWQDGLAAAVKELSVRGHDVLVMTTAKERTVVKHPYFDILVSDDVVADIKEYKPNVILHWADMTRPHARPLADLGIPMAICFAGGEPLGENYPYFDHIFVESQVYEDIYLNEGLTVSRAFGANSTLFHPVEQVSQFDTIFPATFAAWKRHDLYAQATDGLRSLAVGYMYQDHETECWQECLKHNVTILPHVSAEVLHYLLAASKTCVITSQSNGGSQRTVLEAMAMNIPVIVCDSDKFDFAQGLVFEAEPTVENLKQMIDLAMDTEVSTRDHILKKWSEFTYADALEKGLKSICA